MDRRLFLKFTAVAGGTSLIAGYPLLGGQSSAVTVNRYRIAIRRLPSAFEGFTILQLTDLHYGYHFSLERVREIISESNAIPHDITICTGDYIHEKGSEADDIWPLLNELKAPEGVFSVLGNHDYGHAAPRSIYYLKQSGQNLRHEIKRLERGNGSLWLAGAGDFWNDHFSIDWLMDPIPENDCRIVLAHNPDSADTIMGPGPDLIIAGHTHGGQIRLPFAGPLITSVKNRSYTSGLKRSLRGFPVFICKGIGYTRIPMRINCPPEIALLELTRDMKAA